MSMQANLKSQRVATKWHRFAGRLLVRLQWHVSGLLLWLVRRPGLRFVPMPYPAIGNLHQWRLQAQKMETSGALARGSVMKAENLGHFTMGNLQGAIWLRNRMGLQQAFLEDPLLIGILAGRSVKGLSAKVKQESIAEAKAHAAQAHREGTLEEQARALIGPRGGMPHLRQDLVKLAALLRVPLEEKMTVAQIKECIKPMLDVLKANAPNPSASGAASSSQNPPPKKASAPPMKSTPSKAASESLVGNQLQSQQLQFEGMMRRVEEALVSVQQQAVRSQGQLPQVFSLEAASQPDTEMREIPLDQLTPEQCRQLEADGAASMEDVYRQQLEAQFGPLEMVDLTREEVERVLDP